MSTPRGLLAVLSGRVHLIDERLGGACASRGRVTIRTRSGIRAGRRGRNEASGRLYVTYGSWSRDADSEGEEAVEGTQDDNVFVNEYRNALNRPHTIRFGPDESMFFTDAGPFGTRRSGAAVASTVSGSTTVARKS